MKIDKKMIKRKEDTKIKINNFQNMDEYCLRYKLQIIKWANIRINLNPLSIAFLLLVIFSGGIWPSMNLIQCSPIHLRHHHYEKMMQASSNSSSKSQFRNYLNESILSSENNNKNQFLNHNNDIKFLKRLGRSSPKILHHDDLPKSFSKSPTSSTSLIPQCSHVGDSTNEISARAYLAETIFEGKVRSKSTIRDPLGKYGVTFVVQRLHKDQSNGLTALRPRTQVRLYFRQKLNPFKSNQNCVQKYNYKKKLGELTRADIKKGRRYIVFLNGIGPHNYTVIGEPAPKTKKNVRAVTDVLCLNCVRQVGVGGLKDQTLKVNEELKLVCRSWGNPLPALQWFKDGTPVRVSSRLRIQYKKRRSLLEIRTVNHSDAGRYECRGIGVQNISPVVTRSTVTIDSDATELWPLVGSPCPTHQVYCLNEGTCTYYGTIRELSCQCAEGFSGSRCENKDVVNANSTYEPITCYDEVTPSYPCVTVHKPLPKIEYLI